jgi:uncharacterized protein (TIGR03790 family)
MNANLKRWCALLAVVISCAPAQASITANDLVLIVNKQQPEGRRLAEAYAGARGVPDGRIIEIDVPDHVDIAREFYESSIASAVRTQLEERQLRPQAKCLVLFYGIPLRIRERDSTPQERTEVSTTLDPTISTLQAHLKSAATKLETIAASLDPKFRPVNALETSESIRDRLLAANKACSEGIKTVVDAARQQQLAQEIRAAQLALTTMPPLVGMSTTRPSTMPTQQQVDAWISDAANPQARQQVRQTLYFAGNVFQLLVVVEMQKRTLTAKESEASVDSELSCLYLGNYDRTRWVTNPFHQSNMARELKEMMLRTARIDGPTPQIAQRIFENAVAVEKEGLKGDLVLDARGLSGKGGLGTYEYFDQSIRNAVKYAAGAADLTTVFDNNPPLLPNGTSAHAAVYCGWYQVRKYSPTVKLLPGSIAYHVASYEMVSLRSPVETGWCRGLMLDGADVTLGPVGEPYLAAFPPADDFLGLLLTGKPTLVEAYWATIPITSWKMILIGDPLYRPFAAKPVIAMDRLPEALQKAVD